MNTDQIQYYAERAREYEQIYQKPERQEDIARLKTLLTETFSGAQLLEIACGTGFWTQPIAHTAQSILATDINEPVLDIARSKSYHCPVQFQTADVFHADAIPGTFDAIFGGFIWSHIPLQHLPDLIAGLSPKLKRGGKLVFADNQFVPQSSTPIAETDAAGNQYQIRSLQDGSLHRVMKNFPTDQEIHRILDPVSRQLEIIRLQYFWLAVAQIQL